MRNFTSVHFLPRPPRLHVSRIEQPSSEARGDPAQQATYRAGEGATGGDDGAPIDAPVAAPDAPADTATTAGSRFFGVTKPRDLYNTRVYVGSTSVSMCGFQTEAQAAFAYNQAATYLHQAGLARARDKLNDVPPLSDADRSFVEGVVQARLVHCFNATRFKGVFPSEKGRAGAAAKVVSGAMLCMLAHV